MITRRDGPPRRLTRPGMAHAHPPDGGDLVPSSTAPAAATAAGRHRIRPIAGFVPFEAGAIERSIPARFGRQVAEHGGRLAVSGRDGAWSYEQIDRLANRVARAVLSARGPGAEPGALLMERDAPQVAAILGVLKAGKSYVPLAPSYPRARNELIAADSQARLVVTDARNRDAAAHLAGDRAAVLVVDDLDPALDDSDLGLDVPASSPAYIIYTSGSTGAPRGRWRRTATCSTTSATTPTSRGSAPTTGSAA